MSMPTSEPKKDHPVFVVWPPGSQQPRGPGFYPSYPRQNYQYPSNSVPMTTPNAVSGAPQNPRPQQRMPPSSSMQQNFGPPPMNRHHQIMPPGGPPPPPNRGPPPTMQQMHMPGADKYPGQPPHGGMRQYHHLQHQPPPPQQGRSSSSSPPPQPSQPQQAACLVCLQPTPAMSAARGVHVRALLLCSCVRMLREVNGTPAPDVRRKYAKSCRACRYWLELGIKKIENLAKSANVNIQDLLAAQSRYWSAKADAASRTMAAAFAAEAEAMRPVLGLYSPHPEDVRPRSLRKPLIDFVKKSLNEDTIIDFHRRFLDIAPPSMGLSPPRVTIDEDKKDDDDVSPQQVNQHHPGQYRFYSQYHPPPSFYGGPLQHQQMPPMPPMVMPSIPTTVAVAGTQQPPVVAPVSEVAPKQPSSPPRVTFDDETAIQVDDLPPTPSSTGNSTTIDVLASSDTLPTPTTDTPSVSGTSDSRGPNGFFI